MREPDPPGASSFAFLVAQRQQVFGKQDVSGQSGI